MNLLPFRFSCESVVAALSQQNQHQQTHDAHQPDHNTHCGTHDAELTNFPK